MFFAAFLQKLLSDVAGGYSSLFAKMLAQFSENPLDFPRGTPLPNICKALRMPSFAGIRHFRRKSLAAAVAAARRHEPCPLCQNVIGHMSASRLQDEEELVHCCSPFPDRLHLHTLQNVQLGLKL